MWRSITRVSLTNLCNKENRHPEKSRCLSLYELGNRREQYFSGGCAVKPQFP